MTPHCTPLERALLTLLLRSRQPGSTSEEAWGYVNVGELARETGATPRAVWRALHRLEQVGLLKMTTSAAYAPNLNDRSHLN